MVNNYKASIKITDELVRETARVTGDYNPIHFDAKYASNSIYKKRIAHGAILVGFISKILGTEFPGEGTILIKQEFFYKRPVYLEQSIVAVFEMKNIERNKYEIKCVCRNENSEVVLENTSIILWK